MALIILINIILISQMSYTVASVHITTSDLESEAVYEEPGSLPRHLQPVSLRGSDSMFRLEECPAYGVSTIGAS